MKIQQIPLNRAVVNILWKAISSGGKKSNLLFEMLFFMLKNI